MAFNGWTNYATWASHLWLSNDPTTYNLARTVAQETEATFRDWVEAYVWQGLLGVSDDVPACLGSDLIQRELAQIDWHELQNAFRQD